MPQRRSKEKILEALKEFIERKQKEGATEFFKSDPLFSTEKVHPDTAEDFFRIIEKAQKEFPRIEVRGVGGMTLIKILDESATFIKVIDKLIGEPNLSKQTVAELIELRTKFIASGANNQR